MKLVRSNGRALEVRDVGEIVFRLVARGRAPLPIVDAIEDDAAARERLKALISSGFYEREGGHEKAPEEGG